mgnify:CR=1 FL=1
MIFFNLINGFIIFPSMTPIPTRMLPPSSSPIPSHIIPDIIIPKDCDICTMDHIFNTYNNNFCNWCNDNMNIELNFINFIEEGIILWH